MASFLECFPLDHITKLKCDCFYGGLPKLFKAMVAYPKASSNEKMYSDYLQVAWEAEKEEAIEASHNPPIASTSKPRAMSFFPRWKLKGSQLDAIPSTQVVHLEEEGTYKVEHIDSEDPDGIKGMTEEFTVCLARAVKDAQQAEKHCYDCSSPDHFASDCPLVAESKANSPLNWTGGMAPKKGAQAPQGKATMPKVPQEGHPRHRMPNTDSLLESLPL